MRMRLKAPSPHESLHTLLPRKPRVRRWIGLQKLKQHSQVVQRNRAGGFARRMFARPLAHTCLVRRKRLLLLLGERFAALLLLAKLDQRVTPELVCRRNPAGSAGGLMAALSSAVPSLIAFSMASLPSGVEKSSWGV